MTLFTRIARLFSADVHSIIDNLEDPEAILKQSIREMQIAIDNSQTQLLNLNKHHDRYTTAQKKLVTTRDGFEQQLDIAFADNNEALSKSLLGKKLESEYQLEMTELELENLSKQQTEQQSHLEEQQEKLKAIMEKLSLFCDLPTRDWRDDGTNSSNNKYHTVITKDDIELAYLQERQRRSPTPSTLNQPE